MRLYLMSFPTPLSASRYSFAFRLHSECPRPGRSRRAGPWTESPFLCHLGKIPL